LALVAGQALEKKAEPEREVLETVAARATALRALEA
jgi:hypothetical protein